MAWTGDAEDRLDHRNAADDDDDYCTNEKVRKSEVDWSLWENKYWESHYGIYLYFTLHITRGKFTFCFCSGRDAFVRHSKLHSKTSVEALKVNEIAHT